MLKKKTRKTAENQDEGTNLARDVEKTGLGKRLRQKQKHRYSVIDQFSYMRIAVFRKKLKPI
jgi:hypothetical protein